MSILITSPVPELRPIVRKPTRHKPKSLNRKTRSLSSPWRRPHLVVINATPKNGSIAPTQSMARSINAKHVLQATILFQAYQRPVILDPTSSVQPSTDFRPNLDETAPPGRAPNQGALRNQSPAP